MNSILTAVRVSAIISALVLSMGFGISSAKISISGENEWTGPNSENLNEWLIENEIEVCIENYSEVYNDLYLELNTGENEIKENTSVDDIETGSITANIVTENHLNTGAIKWIDSGLGDVSIDFENELTGPNSSNINKAVIEANRDISIRNRANVSNDLSLRANTGNNSIKENTVVGDIETGDIEVSSKTINKINQNTPVVMGSASTDVSAEMSNEITGPNSENLNTLELLNNSDLSISNQAHIDNDTYVKANTGNNSVKENTIVGDVKTGDVEINLSTTNVAN